MGELKVRRERSLTEVKVLTRRMGVECKLRLSCHAHPEKLMRRRRRREMGNKITPRVEQSGKVRLLEGAGA